MLNLSGTDTGITSPTPSSAQGLRVAIVSDAAPERNGVGAYYRDLADHLKANGARVALIAPRHHGERWHGGMQLPLPGDPTQKILVPSWSLVSKRLNRLRPTVIVVPTPGPYGMLGMYLAGRQGVNLVVGFHTHFEALTDLFQDWGLRARIANAYLRTCHRLLFKRSQLVLANSQQMVDVAREIGARRADLMATPIPKRFLDYPAIRAGTEVKRVLFAGRLAPEKNLEVIVEAAQRLPEMEFVIAGDGPLRAWLEQQCGGLPNLNLIGWVSRTRIMALVDSVDALVLPSRVESFGTIALEAMARARPVVVSSACGIMSWDMLSRGIFPIRNDEHLADALTRLRDLDPAMRERKARIAREAAIELNQRNLDHWIAVLRGDFGRSIDATS
ncbi:glycosyltransferase family 1 protein [Thiorhodococcus mannitoliphagus]|uniref:Glycosyltransferase family 1 protein n=1 Tax=Thiorhodococcus mannitoliphagus TaxID=329406 RepID=A0A6P1E1B4_9GAMM|nr:glycosyltransferase [Thiorhodococcus mannitoliphagus]NEX21525.1 glycosyltransferase family 1 protein [Thiorhodococcus mannitoliphagus]